MGCGAGDPEVALPPFADTAVCRALAWPAQVADQARVATAPVDAAVAAWGNPAIIARCGLPPLAPTTAECLRVNDVDWVIRTLTDGASFTTYGTDPALEVLVPGAYAPEPMILPDLTTLAASLPTNGHRCR